MSRGCSFNITYTQRPAALPPLYDIYLNRQASATCPWPAASEKLDTSYNYVPRLSLAANDLGVAASFVLKRTYSGSSPTILGLEHVDPELLTTVRVADIYPAYGRGFIYSGDLSIAADGTTLVVRGTKSGTILGESGSGSNYTATFPNFFTSTTPPTVQAY
ncbi:hypothetical protein K8638_28455 [Myxococcus sp. RHST-1-4]|nr:hypothetical protein [Myxococcus sp. RHSTA-1-4]